MIGRITLLSVFAICVSDMTPSVVLAGPRETQTRAIQEIKAQEKVARSQHDSYGWAEIQALRSFVRGG